MEARVNGIVKLDDYSLLKEVLTAFSGARPWPIEIQELGLDHPQHPDVVLHRFHVESCSTYEQGTRWTASQYSRPPWGDKVLESLQATIRLRKDVRGKVSSMTLGSWKSMGYRTRYHIVKDCVACDVQSPGGICLHVIVYDMYKGVENGDDVEKGERFESSSSIIEVWTHIEGGHEKSLQALAWLGDLLSHYNVFLSPLMDRKKAIQLEKKRTNA